MPKSDQGVDQKRYHVIPRTLIFLFQDDQVLLIKGNKKKRTYGQISIMAWAGMLNLVRIFFHRRIANWKKNLV